MKKTVRFCSLLLAASLAAALFSGCGKGGEGSSSIAGGSAPQKEEGFRILSENLGEEKYGIGFRKGDVALGLEVQRILDGMIADGKAAEISNKWFGEDILLKDADYLKESEASPDDRSLEKVKEAGEFVLGLDDSFPPMGFRDDQNNISGFDIDLAKEVTNRMGVTLKIQPIDWDSKELELSTGKIDCIWNGLSITPERLDAMFFAKPYIANKQIIIVPNDSPIQTKADLEGMVIGLQKGSSSFDALVADDIYPKVKDVEQYPENLTAFLDLKAGRVDAFVVDEVVGRYILETN